MRTTGKSWAIIQTSMLGFGFRASQDLGGAWSVDPEPTLNPEPQILSLRG